MKTNEKETNGLKGQEEELEINCQNDVQLPLEEIVIEELAVDGICGVY